MPSPLKSPTATDLGPVPTTKLTAVLKPRVEQTGALFTVRLNVRVAVPPGPNALTVTGYVPGTMFASAALVTLTTPVTGLAVSLPVKLVGAETLMLVVSIGTAFGVTIMLSLIATVVGG